MDNMQREVLRMQWESLNGNNAINAGFPIHTYRCYADPEGRMVFKYYKTIKAENLPIVKGVQFIVELDYDRDLYNITIEIYKDCDIIYRRSIEGLCWEALNAYELYTNTIHNEYALGRKAI